MLARLLGLCFFSLSLSLALSAAAAGAPAPGGLIAATTVREARAEAVEARAARQHANAPLWLAALNDDLAAYVAAALDERDPDAAYWSYAAAELGARINATAGARPPFGPTDEELETLAGRVRDAGYFVLVLEDRLTLSLDPW